MIDLKKKTCYHCIYFHICGDPDRTEFCFGKTTEEEQKRTVKHFWDNLRRTAKANGYKWIVTIEDIAELMEIDYESAMGWDRLFREYAKELKTERQGGGWVVE